MHVVLKLSKLCNLRCNYCTEFEWLAQRDRMPLEALEFMLEGMAEWVASLAAPPTLRFVLHGGEPLLLPEAYLRGVVGLQRRILGARGIAFQNLTQTNLYHAPPAKLALLRELGIELGISLDVFGGERVTAGGADAQPRVLENLQRLLDSGYADEAGIGAISVLHRGNVAHAEATFDFWNQLGISYRVLPLEAGPDTPERMRDLVLEPEEVLATLLRLARRHAATGTGIRVWPLTDHLQAAIRHVLGLRVTPPRFPEGEWALIVDTNGDVYNDGDAYLPEGLLGNAFRESLAAIFAGAAYRRSVLRRQDRMASCGDCPYRDACTRIPLAEMEISQRRARPDGRLACTTAETLIGFYLEALRSDPALARRLSEGRAALESAARA